MFNTIVKSIFGSSNDRYVKSLGKTVNQINALEESFQQLSDEALFGCTPCRTGCSKAVELMQQDIWDQPLLSDLCDVMQDASICGLGQAAPNPIRLTMKHFADEIS